MNLNTQSFLSDLFKEISELDLDLTDFQLDHLAYKTATNQEYDQVKKELEKIGQLAKESLVGGRDIAIFKLNFPITYQNFKISTFELIAPKSGEKIDSGLEHVEFYKDGNLQAILKKYPSLNWDKSALNREEFPMLKLPLKPGTQVKFPKYPILSDR